MVPTARPSRRGPRARWRLRWFCCPWNTGAVHSLEPANVLLQAHAATGKERYLQASKLILLDWFRQNLDDGIKNAMKWHDHATANRAILIAYAIDAELRKDEPDLEFLVPALKAGVKHVEKLRNPKWHSVTNHGLFVMTGLRSLLVYMPTLKGSEELTRLTTEHVRKILRAQFTKDGFHTEDSPGYHIAITEAVDAVARMDLFTEISEFLPIVQRAQEQSPRMFHPNGDIVNIGDTGEETLHDPAEVLAFLRSDGEEGRPPNWDGWFYSESGIAVYRTPWEKRPFNKHSFLYFMASNHRTGHTHSDLGTFEWSNAGVPILVDSGRYSYDRNQERRFFRSTRAGNTVEIDARDDDMRRGFRGSGLKEAGQLAPDTYWARAEFTRLGQRIEHRRTLVIKDAAWLVVFDDLESDQEHDYRQWFGFHEEITVTRKGEGFLATLPGGAGTVEVQQLLDADGEEPQIAKGQTSPRLQGWISRAFRQKTPRTSIAFVKRARTARFVTVFSVNAAVEGAEVEEATASALRLRFGSHAIDLDFAAPE